MPESSKKKNIGKSGSGNFFFCPQPIIPRTRSPDSDFWYSLKTEEQYSVLDFYHPRNLWACIFRDRKESFVTSPASCVSLSLSFSIGLVEILQSCSYSHYVICEEWLDILSIFFFLVLVENRTGKQNIFEDSTGGSCVKAAKFCRWDQSIDFSNICPQTAAVISENLEKLK